MSDSYAQFASVYDELMTDVPYDTYVELIALAANGLAGKKVLDLGCGTGLLSMKLAKKDAIVTGVDLSPQMLSIASERASALSLPITFIEQPMELLQEQATYDVVVIAIDSLNYVIDELHVKNTLQNAYNALVAGGVLLFDVHSTFKTDVIFMESPFTFDNERIAYLWNTGQGYQPHSVYSELAFFVRQEDGLYNRFDEVHYQRTLPVQKYIELLTAVGFSIDRVFADWEDEPPEEESERIFFQVRK